MNSKGPILNSPRSLEACRRQGIEPEELLYKSKKDLKKELGTEGKQLTKQLMELRWEHYEERRKEKIKILVDERNIIIHEEA